MEDINALLDRIVADANAALAGLPPLEQIAAANELIYPITRLREIGKNLTETIASAKTRLAETVASIKEKAKQHLIKDPAARAALITELASSGSDIITKIAHDGAVASAKETGRQDAETAFAQQRDLETKGTAAKQAAVTAKQIAQPVADKIPLTVWADEAQRTVALARVATRMESVKKANLSMEKHADIVAEMVALPFTEEGDKAFTLQMGPALAAASTAVTASRQGPGTVINPALGVPGGGGGEGKDPNPQHRYL